MFYLNPFTQLIIYNNPLDRFQPQRLIYNRSTNCTGYIIVPCACLRRRSLLYSNISMGDQAVPLNRPLNNEFSKPPPDGMDKTQGLTFYLANCRMDHLTFRAVISPFCPNPAKNIQFDASATTE